MKVGPATSSVGYVGNRNNQGQKHGRGVELYSSTSTSRKEYSGNWENGRRHGNGRYTKSVDGGELVYDGNWENGRRHGHGRYTKPVDEGELVYDGYWENGEKHGKGKQTWPDMKIYEGDFERGKISGSGKMTLPNGTVMEGDFRDGFMFNGTCKWPNGITYTGKFSGNYMHGKGYKVFEDGGTFDGIFDTNEMKHGKRTYSDGSYYNGDFVNDKKHGSGEYVWKDKTKYIGEWKNNEREGYGTQKYHDGRSYKGTWKNGKLYGHCISKSLEGVILLELWENNKIHVSVKEELEVLFIGSNSSVNNNKVDKKESQKNTRRKSQRATLNNSNENLSGVTRDLIMCEDFFKEKAAKFSYLCASDFDLKSTKRKVRQEIFNKQGSEFSQFMIIYSGHGTVPQNDDGGHWEFKDGNIDFKWIAKEWSRSNAYKSWMTTRLVLVIDSCYSGCWIKQWEKLKDKLLKLRIVIQTSAGPDEKAEDTNEGGAFLCSFLKKQKSQKIQKNSKKLSHRPQLSHNTHKIKITDQISLLCESYFTAKKTTTE